MLTHCPPLNEKKGSGLIVWHFGQNFGQVGTWRRGSITIVYHRATGFFSPRRNVNRTAVAAG